MECSGGASEVVKVEDLKSWVASFDSNKKGRRSAFAHEPQSSRRHTHVADAAFQAGGNNNGGRHAITSVFSLSGYMYSKGYHSNALNARTMLNSAATLHCGNLLRQLNQKGLIIGHVIC